MTLWMIGFKLTIMSRYFSVVSGFCQTWDICLNVLAINRLRGYQKNIPLCSRKYKIRIAAPSSSIGIGDLNLTVLWAVNPWSTVSLHRTFDFRLQICLTKVKTGTFSQAVFYLTILERSTTKINPDKNPNCCSSKLRHGILNSAPFYQYLPLRFS